MQQSSSTVRNPADNFDFFVQTWKPKTIKKVLVIQHGFGEHSGRYQNLIGALENEDTAVYALDARGHVMACEPRKDGKLPGCCC